MRPRVNVIRACLKMVEIKKIRRFPYLPRYSFICSDQTIIKSLTETESQYITKVLNLQVRKRKYDLRMI